MGNCTKYDTFVSSSFFFFCLLLACATRPFCIQTNGVCPALPLIAGKGMSNSYERALSRRRSVQKKVLSPSLIVCTARLSEEAPEIMRHFICIFINILISTTTQIVLIFQVFDRRAAAFGAERCIFQSIWMGKI